MTVESKFGIGDKVYNVSNVSIEYPKIRVKCDICDTTGHIHVKGRKYPCPQCGGKYTKDYDNPKAHFTMPNKAPLTVGMVQVRITEDEKEIIYMCKETGIRSGTLYSENRLFATYEEAVKFVENANKELANGKHWSEIP